MELVGWEATDDYIMETEVENVYDYFDCTPVAEIPPILYCHSPAMIEDNIFLTGECWQAITRKDFSLKLDHERCHFRYQNKSSIWIGIGAFEDCGIDQGSRIICRGLPPAVKNCTNEFIQSFEPEPVYRRFDYCTRDMELSIWEIFAASCMMLTGILIIRRVIIQIRHSNKPDPPTLEETYINYNMFTDDHTPITNNSFIEKS
ncbi:MAG: hypothetical protein Harvfovirus2_47 [Harvfovirus sp.]|uniref:Uncharacterized protein n=1 Tax=Harvfovirus sp. TaxID=2487768 RepID=A0A3G5A015_9VIRU|nr:MAG: hypothetical protein Harvfovirus2_47 [Harvfovirus sp.]